MQQRVTRNAEEVLLKWIPTWKHMKLLNTKKKNTLHSEYLKYSNNALVVHESPLTLV